MLRVSFILALGFAATAFAQDASYTGPPFNPSEEAYFAETGLVIPSQTTLPAIAPTEAFSMATTISGVIIPSTMMQSSVATSHATSHSSAATGVSSSAVRSSSSSSRTVSQAASSTVASAPAQQSTGAADVKRVGVVGVVAGGLVAGLALV